MNNPYLIISFSKVLCITGVMSGNDSYVPHGCCVFLPSRFSYRVVIRLQWCSAVSLIDASVAGVDCHCFRSVKLKHALAIVARTTVARSCKTDFQIRK